MIHVTMNNSLPLGQFYIVTILCWKLIIQIGIKLSDNCTFKHM